MPKISSMNDPIQAHQPSDISSQAFAWTVCAEIVSGMMANPSRAQYSVKETVSLFDELLVELEGYIRIKMARGEAHDPSGYGGRVHEYREAPENPAPPLMRPAPQQPAPGSHRPSLPWVPPGQDSRAA